MADCTETNYFRGQGRVLIAPRNSAGLTGGFLYIGDTERLEVNVSQDFIEVQESCSGNRNTVVYTPTTSTWEVALDALNFDKANLARAYYGTGVVESGGSVSDEALKFWAVGDYAPLEHIGISAGSPALTLSENTGGSPVLTEDVDYELDRPNGAIKLLSSSNLTGAAPWTVYADYGFDDYDNVEANTTTQGEYSILFQGINTVDSKVVVVEIHRVALNLAETLSLINADDVNRFTISGRAFPDTTQGADESQYMRIKIAQ